MRTESMDAIISGIERHPENMEVRARAGRGRGALAAGRGRGASGPPALAPRAARPALREATLFSLTRRRFS